jgi:molybdate transport system permease protein
MKNTHSHGWHRASDALFLSTMSFLSTLYILLILSMLAGMWSYTSLADFRTAIQSPEFRYSLRLSLVACTITTILSLWIAVPTGYLFSRFRFPGKALLDAILDIPIVLPPLVLGLALLILFMTPPGKWIQEITEHYFGTRVIYAVPAVILAQFTVACAFAVRTMRVTFDEISPRCEAVALTLGCTRNQAFWLVVVPEARAGMIVAASLAWARSLGEFGPILIFAGTIRGRTEVLSSTIFLELSVGNINAAVTAAFFMIGAALTLLLLIHFFGQRLMPHVD